MTDTERELIPRKRLLDELGISDSSERRGRTGNRDWPPHLSIGKKIFYRRASVDDWLRHQEATSRSAHRDATSSGIDAETMTAILRRAEALADSAPPLTAQQIQILRSLLSSPSGADAP